MPTERGPGGAEGSGRDAPLDRALEDFDGGILAEREVIRARANETAGTRSGPGPAPESASTSGGASGGSEGATDVALGVPSNRSQPPTRPVASASVPQDVRSARDDDIIARQLREAAMQEPDPELREKLWEEYRRYKDS